MPSTRTVPDRVRWALTLVAAGPSDRILEIGSGPGIAAELVCERLQTGWMLAIDRSAVATRRTTERNAAHIQAGRLEVRTVTLESLNVPAGTFDTAFAIDVNLFWTHTPTQPWEILTHALRPGGFLHVCYGVGPQSPERITSTVAEALTAQGFTDVGISTSNSGMGISGRTPD